MLQVHLRVHSGLDYTHTQIFSCPLCYICYHIEEVMDAHIAISHQDFQQRLKEISKLLIPPSLLPAPSLLHTLPASYSCSLPGECDHCSCRDDIGRFSAGPQRNKYALCSRPHEGGDFLYFDSEFLGSDV